MESADYIDLAQWPALILTVAAAWLVGSLRPRWRILGFGLFLLSNALWVIWALPLGAWGLILLQGCLAAMNLRRLLKNERGDARSDRSTGGQP